MGLVLCLRLRVFARGPQEGMIFNAEAQRRHAGGWNDRE